MHVQDDMVRHTVTIIAWSVPAKALSLNVHAAAANGDV